MKVAVYNPLFGQNFAESELARRICLAATNIGWEAREVSSSAQVKFFAPDFVLMLYRNTPKLAGFPTYGCMWDPPSVYEQYFSQIKNVLSYDGYLSSSEKKTLWIRDVLYGTHKKTFIAPFYTSSNETPYCPPNVESPRLVYTGSNWDGPRFKELFEKLDSQEYLEIYGRAEGWKHIQNSYKGALPFDGETVLKTLSKAGVGLCLHRKEHLEADIPSMRIFEIVASGAVAICEEHPFIRKAFGDSVLYVAPHLSVTEQVQQISNYMEWIRNNPQDALELSRKAHSIFTEKYSLEKLLLGIAPYHERLLAEKGFITHSKSREVSDKQVQFIVRIGGRSTAFIKRSLDSIVKQTYKNIKVILVKYKDVEGLETLLENYKNILQIQVINSENTGYRSTAMWDGLKAIDSEYFAFLDDDDAIHPNHVYTLVSLLEKFKNVGFAYSGVVGVYESGEEPNSHPKEPQNSTETSVLRYFERFDLNRFFSLENFIAPSSIVAKSSLFDEDITEDPRLRGGEDLLLFLHFSRKTKFMFSYEVTCDYYLRNSYADNTTYYGQQFWEQEYHRIRFLLWKFDFPTMQSIPFYFSSESELARLTSEIQQAQSTIEAMKTSKFWKLRTKWFKLKRSLGLIVEPEIEFYYTFSPNLQQLNSELQRAQKMIEAMKTSKFWQLRTQWFKLKKFVGLKTD